MVAFSAEGFVEESLDFRCDTIGKDTFFDCMSEDFFGVLCVIFTPQGIEYTALLIHCLFDLIHEAAVFLLTEILKESCMDGKLMGKQGLYLCCIFDIVCDEDSVILVGNIEGFGVFR